MKYKQNHRNQPAQIHNDSEGVVFTQDGSIDPDYITKKCYNCVVVGHISWECPEPKAKRDNSKAKDKNENRGDGDSHVVGLVVE